MQIIEHSAWYLDFQRETHVVLKTVPVSRQTPGIFKFDPFHPPPKKAFFGGVNLGAKNFDFCQFSEFTSVFRLKRRKLTIANKI